MGKILIDFNQLMLANVHVQLSQISEEINVNYIRHLFLNNLIAIKKKFSDYQDVIICCDGPNTWRREVFPYYKYKRKKSRAESPLDWDAIFESLETVRNELKESFAYPVLHVPGAEGDDCIAIMAKYFQTHDLTQQGLEVERQKILIISSDRDFVQLQKYGNVDQYSSIHKVFVRDANPEEYRIQHIIRAGDDGIPNMLSDDDTFANPDKKQVMMTQKRFDALYSMVKSGVIEEKHQANYNRNKKLIDLITEIPVEVEDAIIKAYSEQIAKQKKPMLDYFIEHKLKNLMTDLQYV